MLRVTFLRWLKVVVAPLRGALDRTHDAIDRVLYEQQQDPGLTPIASPDPNTDGTHDLRALGAAGRASPEGASSGLRGGSDGTNELRRAVWEARVWTPPMLGDADEPEPRGRPLASTPRRRTTDAEPRQAWGARDTARSRPLGPAQDPRT